MTTCKYCEREIILDEGIWVDPEADGDDIIWRETCENHDTFVAEHEPRLAAHIPVNQEYLVEWSISIDAATPEDAARQALGIHRDPGSLATVFHVYGDDGSDTILDVEDPDEPIIIRKET